MKKYVLTGTEINMIVQALNKDIASVREDMDRAHDGDAIQAIGEVIMNSRMELVTKLNDLVNSGCKKVQVIIG